MLRKCSKTYVWISSNYRIFCPQRSCLSCSPISWLHCFHNSLSAAPADMVCTIHHPLPLRLLCVNIKLLFKFTIPMRRAAERTFSNRRLKLSAEKSLAVTVGQLASARCVDRLWLNRVVSFRITKTRKAGVGQFCLVPKLRASKRIRFTTRVFLN